MKWDSGSGTYLSKTLFPKLGIADQIAAKKLKALAVGTAAFSYLMPISILIVGLLFLAVAGLLMNVLGKFVLVRARAASVGTTRTRAASYVVLGPSDWACSLRWKAISSPKRLSAAAICACPFRPALPSG